MNHLTLFLLWTVVASDFPYTYCTSYFSPVDFTRLFCWHKSTSTTSCSCTLHRHTQVKKQIYCGNVKGYTGSSLSLCVPCQCSALSVSVSQSLLVRVREKDTIICLSQTITSFLSVTKEYLKSLGNSECSPQTFLENSSSLDKLLIIIQNEDIAAHVHKVRSPAHTLLASPVYRADNSTLAKLQSMYRNNGVLV